MRGQGQNNPTILPCALTSIESAAGTRGRPGMVMISPQIATTNSAPAESRTSRTLMVWSVGAPLASALVENVYCVLAMQTGACRSPCPRTRLELVAHRLVGGHVLGAVDFLGDGADLLEQRHVVGIEQLELALALSHDLDHRARDVGRALPAHRPVIGHQRLDAERLALLLDQRDLGVGVGGEAVDRDHRRDAELLHVLDVALRGWPCRLPAPSGPPS